MDCQLILPEREQVLDCGGEWPEAVTVPKIEVATFVPGTVTVNFLAREPGGKPYAPGGHCQLEGVGKLYPELNRIDMGKEGNIVPKAALINGGPHGADSYWHWMIDYLPRLWAYEQAGYDGPVMVNDYLTPYQFETLHLYAKTVAWIMKPSDVRLPVEELWASSLPCDTGIVAPEAVTFLRGALGDIDNPYNWKRVYLSRQRLPERDHDQRPQASERDLIWHLSEAGFEIVECHNRSFAEQVRAVRNADIIVAPHGGHMANLAFAPPGCTVIEIATKPTHTLGPSICAAADLKHMHVGSEATPDEILALIEDESLAA